jgi:hypothetical protein
MTPQEFIERAPLYSRVELRDFKPPESITRMCASATCKRETTWLQRDNTGCPIDVTPQIQVDAAGFVCGLCRSNSLIVFYEKLEWGSEHPDNASTWHHAAVRKIGQVPPPTITIPADIETQLGTSAEYYKKALVSRESSYGIGAMAYLRRVVDEKTDKLIDVMIELAQTFDVPEPEIEKLKDVKTEVQYEEKLRVAAELIPSALRPGGVNPLGQLYKHTSVGLHGRTDEECISIFDDLKADFEYVFRNLHLQAKERREFAKRVQERAGKKV